MISEWMKVMLGEISRKQAEAEQVRVEERRRDEHGHRDTQGQRDAHGQRDGHEQRNAHGQRDAPGHGDAGIAPQPGDVRVARTRG